MNLIKILIGELENLERVRDRDRERDRRRIPPSLVLKKNTPPNVTPKRDFTSHIRF